MNHSRRRDSLPPLFVVEVTSCVPIQTVETACLFLCGGQDIRVVDIKRAPKSFDARIRCTGRRYEYIMPTFVLARKEHVLGLFDEVRLLASWTKRGVLLFDVSGVAVKGPPRAFDEIYAFPSFSFSAGN